MTGQLALTDTGPLQPGDWTSTGWGAQHRVRRSDPQWTELVCHGPSTVHLGQSDRCETAQIDRTASEDQRCSRCANLPGLGPIVRGPLGQVRTEPSGLVAVAISGNVGSVNRWKIVGDDPQAGSYGWRTDWDVASWTVVGNVHALASLSQEETARILHDANTGRITPDDNDTTRYDDMARAVLDRVAYDPQWSAA